MSFFENRYKKMVSDFTTKLTEQRALRINTLKTSEEQLLQRLKKKKVKLEKLPYLAAGYTYTASFSLGATPEYLLGHYYLQGIPSQVVAALLHPQPGEIILDMAAAPGSKTTHLAQLMQNEGTIIALDNQPQRLAALRNNCERLGVMNVLMFKKDGRFVTDLNMQFDKILLDAPCSGNFCSEQGWFAKRNIADVKANARLQKELLKAAYSVLKPGGTIIYSTCSLEPEEDELVIDWCLKKFSDLSLSNIDIPLGDPGITAWEGKELAEELTKTKRFWPHRTATEGFFIAKLVKK